MALVVGGLLLVSCSDDDPTEPEVRNDPPTATISSPDEGDLYVAGEEIAFQGSGEDREDGTLEGESLAWRSDRDGQLGTGTSFTRDDLSAGDHTITLTAIDSDEATGSDSVTITVREEPAVSIESPAEESTHWGGTEIVFQGRAEDAEGMTLDGNGLVWWSDRDGELGTGGSLARDDLSVAEHVITLTATDSLGVEGVDEISITVALPSIAAPAEGSLFPEGATVRFEASAPGPDGEPLEGGALVWESDRDGPIGTGAVVSTTALSVGSHRITLTATQPGGATASAETEIQVTAPFVLEGTLHPLPGHSVPPLEVRTASGSFEGTTAVASDGTFQATIPEPGLLDSLVVLVDAPDPEGRTHFPIHVNFGGTVPESSSWLPPDIAPDTVFHHFRAALVPLTWTIESGPFVGEEVDLSLEAAATRGADGLSFIFSQDIGTLVDAAWHEDLLPLPVAFHHDSTHVAISESDSVAFWEAVDELEERFGEALFEPAVHPPDEGTIVTGRGTVVVDTTLSAVAAASPYWSRRVHDEGTHGQVTLYSAAVRFREIDGFENQWLVMHEMAHALGLGHTCQWGSILGGSSSGCMGSDPSPEDVAHEQVKRAVGTLRMEVDDDPDRITFGLEYSRLGERVVLLGLPPYPDPHAEALAEGEGLRGPSLQFLGRDGDLLRGRIDYH